MGGRGGDAGTMNSAGSGGSAGSDSCNIDIGCTTEQSGFCGENAVVWLCGATVDLEVLEAGGCTDAGTGAPRFCCPPTFLPECQ
jgi:hypothetical protein